VSWSRRSLVLVCAFAGALPGGCSETTAPSTVDLRLEADVIGVQRSPDEIRLSWLGPDGFLLANIVVASRELGTPGPMLASVRIQLDATSGERRLWARALRAGMPVAEIGQILRIEEIKGKTLNIRMAQGRLRDGDEDGVPDVVDSCPQMPNPDQRRCADGDGGTRDADERDAPGVEDAAPVVDTAASPDARADSRVVEDTHAPDAASADAPKTDAGAPATIDAPIMDAAITAPDAGTESSPPTSTVRRVVAAER
jgi:hypothetical protein